MGLLGLFAELVSRGTEMAEPDDLTSTVITLRQNPIENLAISVLSGYFAVLFTFS